MAYSTLLTVRGPKLTKSGNTTIKDIDIDLISWWRTEELLQDGRFTLNIDLGSYYDYTAKLTQAEAFEIYNRYLVYTPKTKFSIARRERSRRVKIATLRKVVSKRKYAKCEFIVLVYEWNSGF